MYLCCRNGWKSPKYIVHSLSPNIICRTKIHFNFFLKVSRLLGIRTLRSSSFSFFSFKEGSKFFEKETGKPVSVDWEKMSKSKHNGVRPEVRSSSSITIHFHCSQCPPFFRNSYVALKLASFTKLASLHVYVANNLSHRLWCPSKMAAHNVRWPNSNQAS